MEYNRMNLHYNRFRSKSSSAARLFPGPYWVAPDERFRFFHSPSIVTQSLAGEGGGEGGSSPHWGEQFHRGLTLCPVRYAIL